jgi:3-methyl-2-oxobutanoate hydroxymethyltransferase
MSLHKSLTPLSIKNRKNSDKIVALTASSHLMATILDENVDMILVGDSLGMVHHGLPSTLPVSLEMMAMYGKAVVDGCHHALVVVDLPFGSYQESPEQAFHSAAYLMQHTQCHGVKLEGGAVMAPTISFLTKRGIPVMAHLGLTPQSMYQLGGFKRQGTTMEGANTLLEDAAMISTAGAFSVVLEAIPDALASTITKAIPIPTIGIGAGPGCDGQVLVTEDLLGLTKCPPPFVNPIANVRETIIAAAKQFKEQVRNS